MIALFAYLVVGVGADNLVALCFEQNGDVLIESVGHGSSVDATGEIEFIVSESGVPFPLDVSEASHRDFTVTGDESRDFATLIKGDSPEFKVVLYSLTVPSYVKDSLQPGAFGFGSEASLPFSLTARATTVLQI